MKKILVIDDDHFMKSFVEKFVSDVEVEQIYRLPEDESILAKYDGLIVDGSGISNSKHENDLDDREALFRVAAMGPMEMTPRNLKSAESLL